METIASLKTLSTNVAHLVEAEISATGGLLRLAPCWVPRSFLQPGKRLKLHPDDLYAFGLNRGGIDERWFASTTPAANENRTPDEGLSYVVVGRQRFTLAASRRGMRRDSDRRGDLEQVQEVAGLLEVLRQHGPDPAPHAPERRSRPRWSGRKASPSPTTSRRSTTTSATTSPTRSWASSPARPRRRSADASRTGTRATTASSISRRPIGSSPAPAG